MPRVHVSCVLREAPGHRGRNPDVTKTNGPGGEGEGRHHEGLAPQEGRSPARVASPVATVTLENPHANAQNSRPCGSITGKMLGWDRALSAVQLCSLEQVACLLWASVFTPANGAG